ncbi:MAG: MBL fold metallo-hydrolase [Acidobacteria bacterium]|nr:MBL fold metallo-hydrolase [Acidobacteriota bacterium]
MRLSNRCYAVTGLGYSAPWCVNAGFVAGDDLTAVVDTGGNTLSAQTIHGYASAARPGNRMLVVNTEKHFDHIGGNGFFRQHGIDVWDHAGVARTSDEFQAEIAEFNQAIPNQARRERGEARAFFHETRLVHPNRRISGDTRLDLGGCAVEILLTPGHTATNLSVWVPEAGVLFSGDCLICEYLPNLDAGAPADWRTWLESLKRIEALAPAIVVPGHGPVARGKEVQVVVDTVRRVLEESISQGHSPTAPRPPASLRVEPRASASGYMWTAAHQQPGMAAPYSARPPAPLRVEPRA